MNVLIAIDSFKGSLTSLEAAKSIKLGIDRACGASVRVSPIADGGEGTVGALASGLQGTLISTTVTGPLGKKTQAQWGIIESAEEKTAVIEMAEAAGITLVAENELDPLKATTFGVGELISHAIKEGCRKFIIGIGGSCTNDGGTGMLTALGYEFLNAGGERIQPGAAGLEQLAYISRDNVMPELKDCAFRIACDVANPLCGSEGCSAVYGPQKGATPEMIRDMDRWLENYALLSGGDKDFPGTGAAGGIGFAFRTFTNATLEPGIGIILEETGLEEKIKDADIVVTGEGRMDAQTVMGKAPVGVARLAKKYGKPVIAFCGCATPDAGICNEHGIDAYFPILNSVVTLNEALDKDTAARNLTSTAEQVFRLLNIN